MRFDPYSWHGFDRIQAEADLGRSLARLEKTAADAARAADAEWAGFVTRRAAFLRRVAATEALLAAGTFLDRPLEVIAEENHALSADVLPEAYEGGDLDPAGMTARFGAERGPLLAWFASSLRAAVGYAFDGRRPRFGVLIDHFCATVEAADQGRAPFAALRDAATALVREPDDAERVTALRMSFDPSFGLALAIARTAAEPGDARLLYRHGRRITEHELVLFRHLQGLDAARIGRIADQVVRCFLNGYRNRNRTLGERNAVGIRAHIGQERLIAAVADRFAAEGLSACVEDPESTAVNRQVAFDHRFDSAFWFDETVARRGEEGQERAMAACAPFLSRYAGFAYLFKFGEADFRPARKPEATRLSAAQEALFKAHQRRVMEIKERYIAERDISFTAISFPTPEIGPDFAAIFERMIGINTLDTDRWEAVQAHLVDALDGAEAVEVTGTGGNTTAMRVALRKLSDPAKETAFVNCGADINIPVGEVFTSPVLAGTSGRLHLKDTWLARTRYRDLWFEFRDGMIADYGCANFPDPAEGRRHVYEHLLMPHDTLPLGEFAIGTNTFAYVMAREFGILDRLTELVIEKMGPHFAIGDTCFLLNEDVPTFDRRTGKRMVAVDNEKSACRATDFASAYTFKHTDITIPYEEIGSIVAVRQGGARIEILRDGRFTLPGTEPFNAAFAGEAPTVA